MIRALGVTTVALLVGACATAPPVKVEVAPVAAYQRIACPRASAAQRGVLSHRVPAPKPAAGVTLGVLQETVEALNQDAERKARVGSQLARELDKCAGR